MFEFRKITAIIQVSRLESVEQALKEIAVPGISVTKVKGYGEYANFFSRDWTSEHARIEIYTQVDKVDSITAAIMEAAHTGEEGDGIIVVLPAESVYRIKTKARLMRQDL